MFSGSHLFARSARGQAHRGRRERGETRPIDLQLALVAAGLASTMAQLVLIRELIAAFYGNELVLGVILAGWLAWVAVGAWAAPWVFRRGHAGSRDGDVRRLAVGLAATAALLPTQIVLIRASHTLLGTTRGALVTLGPMLAVILVILAPLCTLLGWVFAEGAFLLGERGVRVGTAYIAESAGSFLGGLLFAFVLVRWLDPFQSALGLGAITVAAAALVARAKGNGVTGDVQHAGIDDASGPACPAESKRWSARLGSRWLLLLAGALLAAAIPVGKVLHGATLRWQYQGVRFEADSIYGRVVVTGSGAQRSFFEDGLLIFETQGTAAEEVAHLPLLVHPDPRRVLLIGGGVSGTLGEILRHPSVEAVVYVELDPLLVAAARAELPPEQALALTDPRVTLIHTDGRAFVQQTAAQPSQPFDVIILDLPEPATAQLNRFYTQEFFEAVHRILSPAGLFALRLPWQENYPGPALRRLATSIYLSLAAEFPEIAPVPGEELYLLASTGPVTVEPGILSGRLAERRIVTRSLAPSHFRYLLAADRVAQVRTLLEAEGSVRPNRDLAPIAYFYDMSSWLSRSYARLAGLAAKVSPRWWLWLAGGLLASVITVRIVRRSARRSWTLVVAVACVGLVQMTLEVVVLVGFQVVHGYLYAQIGAIVAAFMAGLAVGSSVSNRWRFGSSKRMGALWGSRLAMAMLQSAIVLLAATFPFLLALRPPAWAFPALALVVGGLTGLVFPVALACMQQDGIRPARAARLLYGADLLGGCAGAALASTVLVPILGIPQLCLATALVGLAGLGLLL